MNRVLLFILGLLVTIILESCGGSNSGSSYSDEIFGYDGSYCADVEYYNPNTGTRSSYTLNVEVEDNVLIVVHWPNGGWLDESHYLPEELTDDGWCTFESDKGYQYEVQINGSPCSWTDDSSFISDREDDHNAVTCPRCGDEKDTYDSICEDCQEEDEEEERRVEEEREEEEDNTCYSCGAIEYGLYGSLCSSCQDDNDDDEDY